MEEMRPYDYHTLTEVVITLLKQMEVDKETMKYIINQVDARLHLQLAQDEIKEFVGQLPDLVKKID